MASGNSRSSKSDASSSAQRNVPEMKRSDGQSRPTSITVPTSGSTNRSTMPAPPIPVRNPSHGFKVAIPRLQVDSDAASMASGSTRGDKRRVSHACESCRIRKVRCSGENPTCAHCNEHGLICIYGDGKRDRARKELGNLRETVDEYESVLRQIAPDVDPKSREIIQSVLDKAASFEGGIDVPSATGKRRRGQGQDAGEPDPEPGGEHFVGAEVGSVGSLDAVHEDINQDESSKAAGFFGKNTDVAWITRVKDQLMEGSSTDGEPPQEGSEGTTPSEGEQPRGKGSQKGLKKKGRVPSGNVLQSGNSSWTYNMDDFDLGSFDQINTLDLPPRPIADQLMNAYFNTVHLSFPLLLKRDFLQVYNQCYQPYGYPMSEQARAIVNMVLALGAKYSVITSGGICDDRDHMALFARARTLTFNNGVMGHTGDLEQVQAAALAVLYMISVGHTNRAWYMSGLAVRYAQGLGLHLRNDTKQLAHVQIELRSRLWWSVYSLERLLGMITGRPSAIHDTDVSTPLPFPIDEDNFPTDGSNIYSTDSGRTAFEGLRPSPSSQPSSSSSSQHSRTRMQSSGSSNSRGSPSQHSRSQKHSKSPSAKLPSRGTSFHPSMMSPSPPKAARGEGQDPGPDLSMPTSATFVIFRIRINILINHILNTLYSASTVQSSWAEVQDFIRTNELALQQWRADLPVAFEFSGTQQDEMLGRERLELGLLFYSTNLLIHRPCLCRLDNKIAKESSTSKEFNFQAASTCVESARKLLNLLPDGHDPTLFYHISPWWALLHYIMQGTTVLIIELKLNLNHVADGREAVLKDCEKALRWLRSMSSVDMSASRAYMLIDRLLMMIEPQVGRNIIQNAERGASSVNWPASFRSMQGVNSPPLQTQPFQDQDPEDLFRDFTLDSASTLPPVPQPGDPFYQPFLYSAFDQDSLFTNQQVSDAAQMQNPMFPSGQHMDGIEEEAQMPDANPNPSQRRGPS